MAGPILYPNVTRIPSTQDAGDLKKQSGVQGGQAGEFSGLLDEQIKQQAPTKTSGLNESQEAALKSSLNSNLNPSVQGLKFSAHATQRLRERQIHLDPDTLGRMNEAINKADAKGVQDTLVLTSQAAMIVNVPNRTVITAMDRGALEGNVFTNIDGAVIV